MSQITSTLLRLLAPLAALLLPSLALAYPKDNRPRNPGLSSMANAAICLEGATIDNFEVCFSATDPTADRVLTLPNATGTLALTANVLALAGGTMTGDITMSGADTQLIFAVDNDAVTPALTLEPGTGFYASADNAIGVAVNAAVVASISATSVQAANANGYYLENAASSTTNPTLAPDQASPTAGIGGTAGDLDFITGGSSRINVDTAGTITVNAVTNQATTWFANDAVQVQLGTGNDFRMLYQTAETPDSTIFALSNDSRGLILTEVPDLAFDFAHALQTNPTLFIHSANQSTTEWISFTHDQTDGVIDTGAGSIKFNDIRRDLVDARTIVDNGAGGNATLTLTPTTSYVEITCQDAQGCDVTMGETGMTAGMVVDICIVAQTAGATNFADSAGVSELAGAFAANVDDCLGLRYGNTTTWRELRRSAN